MSSPNRYGWPGASIDDYLPTSYVCRGIGTKLNMPKFSMLTAWVEGKSHLSYFANIGSRSPGDSCFVVLDYHLPLHESIAAPSQSLAESWRKTNKYVKDALALVEYDEPSCLDGEERQEIKEFLGEPPTACYPLYFVAVGDGSQERVVYIGKTDSRRDRFGSGHAAITKSQSLKAGNP